MTHEAIPIEKEKAASVHVLTGTLTAVDEGAGTVDVTIDGRGDFSSVPVFYHCQGIGTADGMPFIDGNPDRVVIVNYGDPINLSVADMKVVGFEDGLPRECPPAFMLKITTNDGFIATEDNGLLLYIKIYPASDSNNPVPASTPVYNAVTGYWRIGLTDPSSFDPGGYWVDCKTICSFDTQYPGFATTSQRRKVEDLLQAGTYEAELLSSCFRLRLTRDDGTLLTEGGLEAANRFIRRSNFSYVPLTSWYDALTERWVYNITETSIRLDGYFVFYACHLGLMTQYPYRYKTSDHMQAIDLIYPGIYDAAIPFWEKSAQWATPEAFPIIAPDCFDLSTIGPDGVGWEGGGTFASKIYLGVGVTYSKHITVRSSVPYHVGYSAEGLHLSDEFAVANFMVWDHIDEECDSIGNACISSDPGLGDTWSNESVAQITFSGGDLSYVYERDNPGYHRSTVGVGPTMGGATYTVMATNTTPSAHIGYNGPDDNCESSGSLAWTKFRNMFSVGAGYDT